MVRRSAGRAIPVLAGVLLAPAGCRPTTAPPPAADRTAPATPETELPCASMDPAADPAPDPSSTKLPWRSATMPDGSIRMTVGDIDAAPKVKGASSVADYRAPGVRTECEDVKILHTSGWWCTTTVGAVAEQGEIVVGGAAPRARIHSVARPAFHTRCGGRVPRIRQNYAFERDSWSGWRGYGPPAYTAWTTDRVQSGPSVSAACPAGRVGTYDYRLAVTVEVSGLTVDASEAGSAPIRKDCGTGLS